MTRPGFRHIHTRAVLALAALLLLGAGVQAEDRDYRGWDPHKVRTSAFSSVKEKIEVAKSYPAADPNYRENQRAIAQNRWDLPTGELGDVQPDGRYTVFYPDKKVAVYLPGGKTEAVGFRDKTEFPYKTVLYHYPAGTLKSVTLHLSPMDVFVFNQNGELIQGNLEKAFWERPTYEKKVSSVGLKLLATNNIKEKIFFAIEPDRKAVNAFSSETVNRVEITRGMLAYVSNEDELAAILSHEIAHIILRHRNIYPRPTNDELLQLRLRVYTEPRRDSVEFARSQEKELDADRMGLRMLVRAGYQPEAMVSIFQKISSDGSEQEFSTHPSGTRRIKALESQIRGLQRGEASSHALLPDASASPSSAGPRVPQKHKSAETITLGTWSWQAARDEALKHGPILSAAQSGWDTYPKQDPQHAAHVKVLQGEGAAPGRALVAWEAVGLYSQLLKGTQHGLRRYTVQYPGTRAYLVYGRDDGHLNQVALCNQAALPRTCQVSSLHEGAKDQLRFEVTKTEAFVFDATGHLLGYQWNSAVYDAKGEPIARLSFF